MAVPLLGLERLAERLNALEGASPEEVVTPGVRVLRAWGVGVPAEPRTFWKQAKAVLSFLFPAGSVDVPRYVQILPESTQPDTPQAIAESVHEIIRRVFGRGLGEHLRRCAVCGRWMAARYRNKRRCGPACHARAWTRASRRAAGHAQYRPRGSAVAPAASRRTRRRKGG